MKFNHSNDTLYKALQLKKEDAEEIQLFVSSAYCQTSNSHLIEIIFSSYGINGAILAAFILGKIYGNDSLTESLLNNISQN